MRFSMLRYVDGREKEFKRNSVDAYCDMMKAAKLFQKFTTLQDSKYLIQMRGDSIKLERRTTLEMG